MAGGIETEEDGDDLAAETVGALGTVGAEGTGWPLTAGAGGVGEGLTAALGFAPSGSWLGLNGLLPDITRLLHMTTWFDLESFPRDRR